ncbi:host HNS inhibition protein [Pseudomonas phage vB_PpuP-Kurepalu-2]
MAKTLKANVNFGVTIVINSETEKAFEIARAAARESVKQGITNGNKKDSMLHVFASDKTSEEVFEIILRSGIRELVRKELTGELNNGETSATVGNIKVDFEKREVPEVELSERWTKTV